MHCVDLGESFATHIYLQNLASIQPRTSPVKLAGGAAGRFVLKFVEVFNEFQAIQEFQAFDSSFEFHAYMS